MARFFGNVGYGHNEKTGPGIYTDVITERSYFGDVITDTRKSLPGENLHNDLSVGNAISIVADPYANENLHAIRYVVWAGAKWTVSSVEAHSPRLLLRLGEVYNGPTPVADPA
jgi:hypothetical protein